MSAIERLKQSNVNPNADMTGDDWANCILQLDARLVKLERDGNYLPLRDWARTDFGWKCIAHGHAWDGEGPTPTKDCAECERRRRNAEREAMVERAWQAFKPHGWHDDRDCSFFGHSVLQIAADFALTEILCKHGIDATTHASIDESLAKQSAELHAIRLAFGNAQALDDCPTLADKARKCIATIQTLEKKVLDLEQKWATRRCQNCNLQISAGGCPVCRDIIREIVEKSGQRPGDVATVHSPGVGEGIAKG